MALVAAVGEAFLSGFIEVVLDRLASPELVDLIRGKKVDFNLVQRPLQYGTMGSKILVTTRIEKVASMVQTFQTYHLEKLSNEDCWSVFANHACLSPKESTENMDLHKIGNEIVRKCKGLPLAAQSLGGLLRRKRDIKDWNNILNSNIWENESKIIPALRISYHYLPPYLKRCFVYCSLYPKDYQFKKDDLIMLWMAEDLLQKNGKTLEEVGYGYFDDLASRSFFQRSQNGSFVMHDLMHDLATLLGGEFYLRREELANETNIGTTARHLSFSEFSDPVHENYDVFGQAKHLRTFLAINFRSPPFNNEKAPCIILSNLKCLRVLSFRGFPNLDAMPDSIGELIHLRFLDLSVTNIKTLPESLCNLYNLQTLKLVCCYKLTRLPNDMQNLVNLRHLVFSSLCELEEMPNKMSKLKNLQHLSCFHVGRHGEKGIKELGTLSNLQGSLSITKLENVINISEASEAKIMDKKYLEKLSLSWSEDANDHFIDSRSELDILDKLQPTINLKWLDVYGYRGTKFPEWVGDPSYHNLTELDLSDCPNCWALFPSLEYLEFRDLPCWEMWHHSHDPDNSFPVLKFLEINDCPKLKGDLPSHLPMLETIKIQGCNQLGSSLPKAFSIRELNIYQSNKVALDELPLSLEVLRIQGTEVIESVFEAIAITIPTSLQRLYIMDCSSPISFLGDCLPTSLKLLDIENCKNLNFPKQNQWHEPLQSLIIHKSCDSLSTLPLDNLPNLHHLDIFNCENLEHLSASKILSNLVSIKIRNCPKFVSFPREGLSAPNLKELWITNCSNLKSLHCHINTLLPKLQDMHIDKCPEMETFPERGMLPSLRSLCIRNCEKLLRNPSLTSFDMISHLKIGDLRDDAIKSFPNKGFALLPPSLTCLELSGMSSLQTLDCTLILHLTSLQQLTIQYCRQLENMEGERLPVSLIQLKIYGCPLLEERCRMKHPQIWPKISHIKGKDYPSRVFCIAWAKGTVNHMM
ncbi:hypothetical protein TSUD_385670 [Trifolium subterraneum]|uniref:Uncharacterized protein n=1 Tax=Trifolium subterraneum TaxID=3900 RepID=A0A2Z6MWY8_TRISU|nr:hypothetical protein TSUD_385670 [Trifolium subterraneum]